MIVRSTTRKDDTKIIKEIPGLYVIDKLGNHKYVESYTNEVCRPCTGCVLYDDHIYSASDIRKYTIVDSHGLIHDTRFLPTSVGRPLLTGMNKKAIARIRATSVSPVLFTSNVYYIVDKDGHMDVEQIDVSDSDSQPTAGAKPLHNVNTYTKVYDGFNAVIYDIPELKYMNNGVSLREVLCNNDTDIESVRCRLSDEYLNAPLMTLSESALYIVYSSIYNIRSIVEAIMTVVPNGSAVWKRACTDLNIEL